MNKKNLFFLLFCSSIAFANQITAPVSGFAKRFASEEAITNADITILENGIKLKTDKNGNFGPFDWPVGKPITLVLEKSGYVTTQSATIIVPPEGLTGPHHNITFQVLDPLTFLLFSTAMGKKLDENKCQVAATVTAYQKTLEDIPQGEEHAIAVLTPISAEMPFYLDIFKTGPLKNHTNPFTRNLTDTSLDGGVVFTNLEPQETPYHLTAIKNGVIFSDTQFICRKGMFVNLSPPQGPIVIRESD